MGGEEGCEEGGGEAVEVWVLLSTELVTEAEQLAASSGVASGDMLGWV